MPRTQREYALRYADQAINDLERSLEKLGELEKMYKADDPRYANYNQAFLTIASLVTTPLEFLKEFREKHM